MKQSTSLKSNPKSTDKMLEVILKTLDENKAMDVVSIDLRGRSSLADFLIIATGTSSRQLQALTEYLSVALKKAHFEILSTEGIQGGDWVILDMGDIIVHLFRPEVRAFYQLEKMWEVTDQNSITKE